MKCSRENCSNEARRGGLYGRPPELCLPCHLISNHEKQQQKRCVRCWRLYKRNVSAVAESRGGWSVCKDCFEWLSLSRQERSRVRYQDRKQAGVCTRCGEPAIDGITFCGDCKVRQALAQERHEQRRAATGSTRAA